MTLKIQPQPSAVPSLPVAAQAAVPAPVNAPDAGPVSKDAFAQTHTHGARCGCNVPDLAPAEMAQMESKVQDKITELRAQGQSLTPAEPRVIDVYFHVINDGESVAQGNLTQEMVQAQIDVLNDAYKGAGFQFNLVETTRTTNSKWYTAQPRTAAETEMKSTLRQGGKDALNIYSSNPSGGLLGWATFPSDYKNAPLRDGVVILAQSVPGGSSAPYNEGDTGTHEVGHWMGLHHTFDQPSLPDNDSISDTPQHKVNYGKPPEGTDTLPNKPGLDPIHNYMNYVDDDWMHEFTPGQVERMQAQFALFRDEPLPTESEPLPEVACD